MLRYCYLFFFQCYQNVTFFRTFAQEIKNMREKQENKLKMYLKTKSVLEKNNANWSNATEVKNILDEFYSNTDKIVDLKTDCEKDVTEFLDKKTSVREELINQAVPLFNVLQVYAYDTKNANLAKKVNHSRKQLKKAKDSELVNTVRTAWKIAKELIGKSIDENPKSKKKSTAKAINLSGYGISTEMIDALEEANKQFIEAALAVKDSISFRNASNKNITDKIKTTDKLLRNRLDKVMTVYEMNDKDFYNSYTEARLVEDTKKILKAKNKEEEKSARNTAEENANVEVQTADTEELKNTVSPVSNATLPA